ncbi:cysteine desulfurase [Escherichia coli]|nr:cysteine desulfurase [Escherichia coli]
MERLRGLRNRLWNGIKDIEEVYLNGDLEHGAPNILNVSFNYVEGESLIMALKDLAVSSGSACTSASLEPSYVLRALGLNDELAHSSIRFSLGRFTTEEEIDYTIELVRNPSVVCVTFSAVGNVQAGRGSEQHRMGSSLIGIGIRRIYNGLQRKSYRPLRESA